MAQLLNSLRTQQPEYINPLHSGRGRHEGNTDVDMTTGHIAGDSEGARGEAGEASFYKLDSLN